MRKILGAIMIFSSTAFGGGSIGGSGGMTVICVEEHEMKELQEGVLRDEFIHIKIHGGVERFLLPKKDSVQLDHLSANDLETGDEVTIQVEQPTSKLQYEVTQSITKAVLVTTAGAFSQEWLILYPKMKVETVQASKVPQELISKVQPTQ